jgi:hypothetical protein
MREAGDGGSMSGLSWVDNRYEGGKNAENSLDGWGGFLGSRVEMIHARCGGLRRNDIQHDSGPHLFACWKKQ